MFRLGSLSLLEFLFTGCGLSKLDGPPRPSVFPPPPAGDSVLQVDPPLSCPANFVFVSANSVVVANADFCVAKYEMKVLGEQEGDRDYDPSLRAESRMTGIPWTNIQREQAVAECQELGAGYDLISNPQWQAMAREIEVAAGPQGQLLNWSSFSSGGHNLINMGRHLGYTVPRYGPVDAGLNNLPCYLSEPECADYTDPDFRSRRIHYLASGEVIWDVSGNAFEWIKGSFGLAEPVYDYVSQEPWSSSGFKTQFGPAGSYLTKDAGRYGGLGWFSASFGLDGIIRGGDHGSYETGIFSVLGSRPDNSLDSLGFRCVYSN